MLENGRGWWKRLAIIRLVFFFLRVYVKYMDNKNQIPFPEIVISRTLEKIEQAARKIGSLFCITQLSPVSEHFSHPLDDTFDLERERILGHKVLTGEITSFQAYCEINNVYQPTLWDGSGLPPAA